MNIKEFSHIAGISAHTLRYYEKVGIFQDINRNASGHRDFTETDIAWAKFINRLKETGMPLAQIRQYADLRKQGASTTHARRQLLMHHAAFLETKIEAEQRHLDKIHEKIKLYEKLLIEGIPLDLE